MLNRHSLHSPLHSHSIPRFLNMRQGEGEAISTVEQAIDLISVAKEIHGLNSQELNKLLRDSENFTIHFVTEKGLGVKIDVEKLVGFLPLHLIVVLVSSDRDEVLLRYLLCGIRILHTLCELAPQHTKLEQVDVFSFGIALWEILTRKEPYASMHCGAIIGGIVDNTLRPSTPERCDPKWKKLMEECWLFEPSSRPSFTEITNKLRQMSMVLQPKQRTPIR